ncbi:hypothetical protein NBRGN_110_03690 [Nocardia brasiliensis NBRC 14402]|uniref:DUF418 domain-containing protein n=1 Tax=Nocardia brasiliensis TaxID=37326 RepID=UPI0002FD9FF9|nr:DUF418 domain-containing protein [Nocardia brasiliensis]ASF09372.1 DUF418 domain-containing protein [Nocardia brasiliensis]GAJ86702.1 hypothetical protein NBRGN_110_03690 [Nocardia brasiliensis NBRC 14402]SUB39933.1 Predicted membrane protein [Nocardia brasiliensis]
MTALATSTELRTGQAPPRLLGVDAVRGLALLGVFLMHFHMSGWLHTGAPDVATAPVAWLQNETSSRAMSLFILLAGVSVALMTGGARPYTGQRMSLARRRLAVRAGMIFLIGLCLESAAPNVLEFYGVLLLLLVPCTDLRPRTLALMSAAAMPAVTLYAVWVMNNHMSWLMTEIPSGPAILLQPQHWAAYLFSLVGYGGGFQTVYGIPLVLAGIAIGRLDLRATAVRRRMAGGGLALALTASAVAALVPHLLPAADMLTWRSLFDMPGATAPYATSLVGITFMIGVALLLLGLLLPLLDRPRAQLLLWPLVAAGSMTLTWYVGHLLFLYSVLEPRTQFSVAGFGGVIVAVLALSALWRKRFRRGPLEWLVHIAMVTAVPGPRRVPAGAA